MDLKILSNLNFNKNNLNKALKNPIGANLKLNQLTKDTFSFTSKSEDPEDLYSGYYDCDNSHYNHDTNSPTGTDYSILDTINTKRDKTIPEIIEDAKAGKDIEEYRTALIYSRIKTAIKDAKEFTEEHPEFSYDDICQDLIEIIIRETNKELEGKINVLGSTTYHTRKNNYFDNLLNKTKEDNIPLTEDFEDELLEAEERDYEDNFEKYIERVGFYIGLNQALGKLSPREKGILEEYYGLNGKTTDTFEKIGRKYKISAQGANAVVQKAIRKLRRPGKVEKIRDYFEF